MYPARISRPSAARQCSSPAPTPSPRTSSSRWRTRCRRPPSSPPSTPDTCPSSRVSPPSLSYSATGDGSCLGIVYVPYSRTLLINCKDILLNLDDCDVAGEWKIFNLNPVENPNFLWCHLHFRLSDAIVHVGVQDGNLSYRCTRRDCKKDHLSTLQLGHWTFWKNPIGLKT